MVRRGAVLVIVGLVVLCVPVFVDMGLGLCVVCLFWVVLVVEGR